MLTRNYMCAAAALLVGFLACGQAMAATVQFDVDDTGTNNTQGGFTPVNLNGINGVTFTPVGGSVLAQRNRGAGNTDGAGGDVAHNDMWRDFVFADDRSTPSGGSTAGVTGMDINVGGLQPNEFYNVRLWAFDDSSNGGRNMTWNNHALALPDSPDPTSLNDNAVKFPAKTDASGNLLLEGRAGTPVGVCCNVFANGFELTQNEPLEFKIDIDSTTGGPINTEQGFASLDATGGNGSSVNIAGIDFSIGSADGSRNRVSGSNALTNDFAFDDGAGQAVILFFGGAGDLPAGEWEVEVFAHDNDFAVGGDLIVGLRQNNAETIIGSNFVSSPTDPITKFRFTSDGVSAYDVFVRENNAANRARLNAVVLRQVVPEPATAALGLLGIFALAARRRRRQA